VEKVMYAVWRDPVMDAETFARVLLDDVAPRLRRAGVHGLQVNVMDRDVAAGTGLVPDGLRRIATAPQLEAVVSVWLDSAVAALRAPIDASLDASSLRTAGYLVCESEPVPNSTASSLCGERTHGFAQLAFLQCPPRLSRSEWLNRWRDHHTDVAVRTQSTFEYRQNLVVDRFDPSAPLFDGIVEENFPHAALDDRHVFYDAVDDDQRLAANRRAMTESTRTFIDHDRLLDVLPTSQYVFVRPGTDHRAGEI
jgi:hypothetical protein